MDCIRRQLPQSFFNIQSADVVDFLWKEYGKLIPGEKAESNLHPHQVEAVLTLTEYFKGNLQINPNGSNIALVVLPTGCGKTGVAVLASYALNATRVLVITPSIIISRQIHAAYGNFLLDYGVITQDMARYMIPSKILITRSIDIVPGLATNDVMIVNAHKIGGKSSVKIEKIPSDGFDLVIVDEAHHYPAPTWKLLVDHFPNSRRLFLTATPEHGGKPILDIRPCYELKRSVAIEKGIVRDVLFDENIGGDEEYRYPSIAIRMEQYLDAHDRADPTVKHQGMVLTQTKVGINPAETFCEIYNGLYPGKCAVYVSETKRSVLEAFMKGEVRTLVIIGRLLEGFDHKLVSVLGIVRNVAPSSRVLFAQFVGRAVRKISVADPVNAQIVTHECFNQRINFDTFEKLAEEDPNDDNN